MISRVSRRLSSTLITIGLALLVAACGIEIYNSIEDYSAGKRAEYVLEQIQQPPSASPEPDVNGYVAVTVDDEPPPPIETDTIGVLTITRLDLELPVLRECTEDTLSVSVCRYLGSSLVKPKRLVIAGHNYKRHFGNLPKLVAGDEVLFTCPSGEVYRYAVTNTKVISEYDHSALRQGEWDIALFTCNSDGSKRIVVQCREVREEKLLYSK